MIKNRIAPAIALAVIVCSSLTCAFNQTGNNKTSNTNSGSTQPSGDEVLDSNTIEVETLANGIVLVKDNQGNYGLAFPKDWIAGTNNEEFFQPVKDAAHIQPFVGIAFGEILQNPGATRIFAFDASPGHLTADLFSIITVASALDESCLNMPISEIGNAASHDLLAKNPNAILLESKEGESQFGAPWMYYSTIIESPDTFTAYTGLVVAKAGDACLKINYMTDNKDINVFSELEFTLNSIAGIE